MKKMLVYLLVFMLLICPLYGCGEADETPVSPLTGGIYKLTGTADSDSEYVFTPYISIDLADSSFTLNYDPLSSYMPTGSFTVADSRLICKTGDGMYTYTFTVIDPDTLAFDAAHSSPLIYIDAQLSTLIADGAQFRLVR